MARDQIQDAARDENPYQDKRKWMARWKYLDSNCAVDLVLKPNPALRVSITQNLKVTSWPPDAAISFHIQHRKRKMSLKILTCAYKNNSNELHRV